MEIKVKYIKNKKHLDGLKNLIQGYLAGCQTEEPIATLTIVSYQDKEGNFTDDGFKYVKVIKEVYKEQNRVSIKEY